MLLPGWCPPNFLLARFSVLWLLLVSKDKIAPKKKRAVSKVLHKERQKGLSWRERSWILYINSGNCFQVADSGRDDYRPQSCCIELYRAASCCIVLYRVALCCIELYCAVSCCIVLYFRMMQPGIFVSYFLYCGENKMWHVVEKMNFRFKFCLNTQISCC